MRWINWAPSHYHRRPRLAVVAVVEAAGKATIYLNSHWNKFHGTTPDPIVGSSSTISFTIWLKCWRHCEMVVIPVAMTSYWNKPEETLQSHFIASVIRWTPIGKWTDISSVSFPCINASAIWEGIALSIWFYWYGITIISKLPVKGHWTLTTTLAVQYLHVPEV